MASGYHLSPGPMLTFPHLRVHQIAYVTTDLDEALKRVEDAFGLRQYYFINTLEQPSHPQQPGLRLALVRTAGRSEEHTSELQSLMRISYAVFSFKKKNQRN